MRDHARIVIIGGGIAGCSLAYHLADMGVTDVVLVEKDELTSGATWHAAGLCTQFSHSVNIGGLLKYSIELYQRLEAETGVATGYRAVGSLRLATTPERLDEYRAVADRARVNGIPFEIVGPAEAAELWPLLETNGLLGAAYMPTDGWVDPSGITKALATGARRRDVEIVRGARVTGLTALPGGGWKVETDRGTVTAETVVNAAGLWARKIGRMAGLALPITTMSHHYLVTEAIGEVAELTTELPVLRDADASYYVRQELDGLVVGPFETDVRAVEDLPWEASHHLLPPDLDRLQEQMDLAESRVPALQRTGIRTVVNGPDAFTPDGLCLMGWVQGARDFFVLAGFSMFGIVFGGGAGKRAAEWIVEGQPRSSMWELDVRRFGPYAAAPQYVDARACEAHVREYAVRYPDEYLAAGRPAKTSPVHGMLKESGAVFGATGGWERPLWFAPKGVERRDEPGFRRPNWFDHVGRECRAVRRAVGILDQTSFAKFEIAGTGAVQFLDRLCANALPGTEGAIAVTQMLTRTGGIECDLTVTRLTEDRFYVVSAASTGTHDRAWIEHQMPRDDSVTFQEVTSHYAVLTVAGPGSRRLLEQVTTSDVSKEAFRPLTMQRIDIGWASVRAFRLSYVGELGWELHVPMEYQRYVYSLLREAGEELRLVDFGYRALDALRLEKVFLLWGADLLTDYTPLEAGLERFVRFDKGDFVGREALIRQQAEGVGRRLVSMTVDVADGMPHGGEPIFAGGTLVGFVTSGGFGHTVGRAIALGYLPIELSEPGTDLGISVLGDERHARACGPAMQPVPHS